MSWLKDKIPLFKKKEDEELLPDLPESSVELPRLPEVGKLDAPIIDHSLPPSPVPNQDLGIKPLTHEINGKVQDSKGMQKSDFEPLPISHDVMSPKKMVESSHIKEPPKTVELSEKTKPISRIKKAEPVYIRLDKFKAGLESFEEIKNKVRDIEELLGNIRETKEREERELEEWEREIQILKSRIESIDSSVFGGLE